MSQYCNYNDLLNLIDVVQLAALSNDYNGNNQVNLTTINAVCTMASGVCDSLVSSIYQVPFAAPYPAKIYQASIVFAAEMLYQRRLLPDDKNIFKPQADMWRKILTQVNLGELSLDSNSTRDVNPIVAKTTCTRVDTNIF